jgi:hypothetical protein
MDNQKTNKNIDMVKENNCFYKVTLTKGKLTKHERWGYYTWKFVLQEIKENYKQGCDAVVLEMITEKQFNKADNSPLTDKELKEWYNVSN